MLLSQFIPNRSISNTSARVVDRNHPEQQISEDLKITRQIDHFPNSDAGHMWVRTKFRSCFSQQDPVKVRHRFYKNLKEFWK